MREVVVDMEIMCSREWVIRSFTEFSLLCHWWSVERCQIEKKNGGIYVLAWNVTNAGFGFVSSGTIKEYHPTDILYIENLVYLNPERPILGPMTLKVTTIELAEGCRVRLEQGGYQEGPDWDWYYQAVKEAWPVVLSDLKVFLERL